MQIISLLREKTRMHQAPSKEAPVHFSPCCNCALCADKLHKNSDLFVNRQCCCVLRLENEDAHDGTKKFTLGRYLVLKPLIHPPGLDNAAQTQNPADRLLVCGSRNRTKGRRCDDDASVLADLTQHERLCDALVRWPQPLSLFPPHPLHQALRHAGCAPSLRRRLFDRHGQRRQLRQRRRRRKRLWQQVWQGGRGRQRLRCLCFAPCGELGALHLQRAALALQLDSLALKRPRAQNVVVRIGRCRVVFVEDFDKLRAMRCSSSSSSSGERRRNWGGWAWQAPGRDLLHRSSASRGGTQHSWRRKHGRLAAQRGHHNRRAQERRRPGTALVLFGFGRRRQVVVERH